MESLDYFIIFSLFLSIAALSTSLYFVFKQKPINHKSEKYHNFSCDFDNHSDDFECNSNQHCDDLRKKCEQQMAYLYSPALYNNPIGSFMKAKCIQSWRKCNAQSKAK